QARAPRQSRTHYPSPGDRLGAWHRVLQRRRRVGPQELPYFRRQPAHARAGESTPGKHRHQSGSVSHPGSRHRFGGLHVRAHLAGALAAGLALRALFSPTAWGPSNIGTPALGSGVSPVAGIAIEAVLTVILVLVVFGTAVDDRAPQLGGLAIGLAVAADILMG